MEKLDVLAAFSAVAHAVRELQDEAELGDFTEEVFSHDKMRILVAADLPVFLRYRITYLLYK